MKGLVVFGLVVGTIAYLTSAAALSRPVPDDVIYRNSVHLAPGEFARFAVRVSPPDRYKVRVRDRRSGDVGARLVTSQKPRRRMRVGGIGVRIVLSERLVTRVANVAHRGRWVQVRVLN